MTTGVTVSGSTAQTKRRLTAALAESAEKNELGELSVFCGLKVFVQLQFDPDGPPVPGLRGGTFRDGCLLV